MIEEFIQTGAGLFVKSDTYEEVVKDLNQSDLMIGNTLLIAGEKTDLDGFFNVKPARYVGFLEKEDTRCKYMYFYLGQQDEELFNTAHYFEKIFWVTPTRFFCHFVPSGGRDFNYINGTWDWQRKYKNAKFYDPETEKV